MQRLQEKRGEIAFLPTVSYGSAPFSGEDIVKVKDRADATGWKVDGIMGILVSVFILWSGIGLARDTISPLLGEGVKSDFRKELTEEIMSYPMVLGCHDLMVHDYGPGKTVREYPCGI